jgi:hypothetical protein
MYREFNTTYLPDLSRFVVPIFHEDEYGTESLGTGVFVNILGRHFVASARHCIERNPRIMLGDYRWTNNKAIAKRPVRIFRSALHATLDIGFLEIEPASQHELQAQQLFVGQVENGYLFVLGYPVSELVQNKVVGDICVTGWPFGTTVIEQTASVLRLAYPESGFTFDEARRAFVTEPFPKTPKGFSGGGVFGVMKRQCSGLEVIEYKLVGIQHSWHPTERWMQAVPIRQWCDLVNRSCGFRDASRGESHDRRD